MGKAKRFNAYDNIVKEAREKVKNFGLDRQTLSGITSSFRSPPLQPPIATSGGATNDPDTSSNEFKDDLFTIYDNLDDTRKLQFQTGGIAASTTRTLTAPNLSGTICLLDSGTTQVFATAIDMNGKTVILDEDGDTKILAPLDDLFSIDVGGISRVLIINTKIDYFLPVHHNDNKLILDSDEDTSISTPSDDVMTFEVGGSTRALLTNTLFDLVVPLDMSGNAIDDVSSSDTLALLGAANIFTANQTVRKTSLITMKYDRTDTFTSADELAKYSFTGDDDGGGADKIYGGFVVRRQVGTAGAHEGQILFQVAEGGSNTNILRLDGQGNAIKVEGTHVLNLNNNEVNNVKGLDLEAGGPSNTTTLPVIWADASGDLIENVATGDQFLKTVNGVTVEAHDLDRLLIATVTQNGPDLDLQNNDQTPQDNDIVAQIFFQGNDDTPTGANWGAIEVEQNDVSAGAKQGSFKVSCQSDNSLQTIIDFSGSDAVFRFSSGVDVVRPNRDDAIDLGATAQEWKDLWIDGTANIDTLAATTMSGDITMGTNSIIGIDELEFTEEVNSPAGTVTYINWDSSVMSFNVPTGDSFFWRVNGVAQLSMNTTNLTMNSVDIDMDNNDVNNIQALKFNDGTLDSIIGISGQIQFNIDAGGNYDFRIDSNSIFAILGDGIDMIDTLGIQSSSGFTYFMTGATKPTTLGNSNNVGALGIPYKVAVTDSPSTGNLNAWFGDQNGCIGVQFDDDSPDVYTLWVKANDVWKKVILT